MILFPNAKINLGLHVLHKRADGFHEIETCMVPVPFFDVLEILKANDFSFRQTGITVPGDTEGNLCVRAFRLMQERYAIANVYMQLRKELPMGAGMGGGSSDAAFVLKGINDLFDLKCTDEELRELAAILGSDCPFFISNKPQIARGRGEILEGIELDLKGYFIKLICPGIHVGTKEAYAGVSFGANKHSVAGILRQPIDNWKNLLVNDFEESVFRSHPILAKIKGNLYQEGANYAAMSGSGSTMFGLFKNRPSATVSKDKTFTEYIFEL